MADLFDNPLGTDGFEFVEYTSPDPHTLGKLFEGFGFTAVSKHRSKNVLRYKQGDINFILNMEPSGQPAAFRGVHGQGANAMAFRVKDAAKAYAEAIKRGAEAAKIEKRVTSHALRHSFATHLLDKGTDVMMIMKLLGHNDIKTTLRYLHVTNRDMLQIISPLDDLKLD